MSIDRLPRPPGRGWLRLLPFLLVGWLGSALPAQAIAQSSELATRNLEYDAAVDALRARTSEWNAQQSVFVGKLDATQAAVGSGDRNRIAAADSAAWSAAAELGRLRRLVDEAERAVTARRSSLETALRSEIAAAERRRTSAQPAERAQITRQIDGWTAQLLDLRDQASADAQRIRLVYLPNVGFDIDPRMDLEAIRASVSLIDRKMSDTRAELARVEQELAALQNSLRQQRASQDNARSLTRFGAGDPVGTTRPRSTEAATSSDPRALQERIDSQSTYKTELETMLRQLDQRVTDIRTRYGLPQARGAGQ